MRAAILAPQACTTKKIQVQITPSINMVPAIASLVVINSIAFLAQNLASPNTMIQEKRWVARSSLKLNITRYIWRQPVVIQSCLTDGACLANSVLLIITRRKWRLRAVLQEAQAPSAGIMHWALIIA